jgi:hypothetical protein
LLPRGAWRYSWALAAVVIGPKAVAAIAAAVASEVSCFVKVIFVPKPVLFWCRLPRQR